MRRGLEVDIVFELTRSDDQAEEWRKGRMVDPETRVIYHTYVVYVYESLCVCLCMYVCMYVRVYVCMSAS